MFSRFRKPLPILISSLIVVLVDSLLSLFVWKRIELRIFSLCLLIFFDSSCIGSSHTRRLQHSIYPVLSSHHKWPELTLFSWHISSGCRHYIGLFSYSVLRHESTLHLNNSTNNLCLCYIPNFIASAVNAVIYVVSEHKIITFFK